MIKFILFSLYLCFGTLTIVAWPILAHPTLPIKRKLLLVIASFVLIVPVGMTLYLLLGAPMLAATQ